MGLPPEVPILFDYAYHIFVRGVHAVNKILVIVGYQVIVDGALVATNRVYLSLNLNNHDLLCVKICKQVFGHLGNNCSIHHTMPFH